MTSFRRAGLGLLVVLLLAVSATAVGFAMRRSTGPDLDAAATVHARPVAQDAPVQPVAEPVAEPPRRVRTRRAPRSAPCTRWSPAASCSRRATPG